MREVAYLSLIFTDFSNKSDERKDVSSFLGISDIFIYRRAAESKFFTRVDKILKLSL